MKFFGVRLMELGFKLEPLPWTPPPPLYDALYQRLRQRDALLEIRIQEHNRLHALHQWVTPQPAVVARYQTHIAFLTEQIDALQAEIEHLLRSDSAWATTTHYLLSIKGIGPITAAWLLVATLNFTTCQTVEQLVAFAGLAPYHSNQRPVSTARVVLGVEAMHAYAQPSIWPPSHPFALIRSSVASIAVYDNAANPPKWLCALALAN